MARTLKSAPDIHAVPAGLHPPSYTSWSSGCPAQCRDADSIVHRHEVGSPLPQGPRSCPSHAVSSHHHLIDPMRPTRGHIAISPHGGLFTMPSLCGTSGSGLSLYRPLRPRGVRASYSNFTMPTWVFAKSSLARHSQYSRNPLHAGAQFRGFTGSQLLRPVGLHVFPRRI
jgi:hypothetical protein